MDGGLSYKLRRWSGRLGGGKWGIPKHPNARARLRNRAESLISPQSDNPMGAQKNVAGPTAMPSSPRDVSPPPFYPSSPSHQEHKAVDFTAWPEENKRIDESWPNVSRVLPGASSESDMEYADVRRRYPTLHAPRDGWELQRILAAACCNDIRGTTLMG